MIYRIKPNITMCAHSVAQLELRIHLLAHKGPYTAKTRM
jgi:hypothetical protein